MVPLITLKPFSYIALDPIEHGRTGQLVKYHKVKCKSVQYKEELIAKNND